MIRFLLTANLTRLAKWLRFLGYDAVVREELGFDALVTLARRQRRILLTRSRLQASDQRVFSRRRILNDAHVDQLRELSDLLVFDEEKILTRCGECNRRLGTVASERTGIPAHVAEAQAEVKLCRHCGKYYWKGNHWREIRETLAHALNGEPTGSETSPSPPV